MSERESGFRMYENILVFAEKYRGLKIISEKAKDERDFVHTVEKYEYFVLECIDPSRPGYKQGKQTDYVSKDSTKKGKPWGRRVFIFIMSPTTEIVTKSPKFVQLKHKIEKKDKEWVDMIIISLNGFNSHIKKKVNTDLIKSRIMVYNYIYDVFKQVMPEAKNVTIPKHTVIRGKKAIQKIMRENYVHNIEQFARVRANDVQVIWVGGQPGDLIEIEGPSENAGKRLAYRLVIS